MNSTNGEVARRHLAELSRRVQQMTSAMPDSLTVYGLFLTKGPSLNGGHYKSAMKVLDVCMSDQDPVINVAVQALTVWHFQLCKEGYSPTDYDRLDIATRDLYRHLQPLASMAGASVDTPKLHRIRDYGKVIRLFGGARHVTTDMFETAHKRLKAVLPRYAIAQCLSLRLNARAHCRSVSFSRLL